MPLPKLIEVVPLSSTQLDAFKTKKAEIVIPGSKSITNRAIVLAALSDGAVTLKGALWSEDTEAMTDCMHRLGIKAEVATDPDNAANRVITVHGCGGNVPKGGTEDAPLELFVANAGTAARFLTAMVCLGSGVYRLSGVPRMHERPQKELIRALRSLGYRIDTPNGAPQLSPCWLLRDSEARARCTRAVCKCTISASMHVHNKPPLRLLFTQICSQHSFTVMVQNLGQWW